MLNSRTVRLLVITAIAASLVAVPHHAQGHHRRNFFCSSSGDLCQSARKVDGVRKLGLLLAAKYFKTFHLCVTDPDGFESCVPFRVRTHDAGTFGRAVRWRKHFPPGGPGAHTVKWMVDDDRIGRKLGFHVD